MTAGLRVSAQESDRVHFIWEYQGLFMPGVRPPSQIGYLRHRQYEAIPISATKKNTFVRREQRPSAKKQLTKQEARCKTSPEAENYKLHTVVMRPK